MSGTAFQTFMTGGVLLLVISITAIGWILWSARDARDDAEDAALEGVGHELKLNLQRMLMELANLSGTKSYRKGSLMEVLHPQLDAVNSGLVHCDRRALAVIGATYQDLQARKLLLQSDLESGGEGKSEYAAAVDAAVNGLTTLYMWDAHNGQRPDQAPSVRSWDVRDWLKTNGFGQIELPGMHLRDTVVARLRAYGLKLTPKPLSHTAHEYWSMQYDRQADPRGVFGARRQPKEKPVEVERQVESEVEKPAKKWSLKDRLKPKNDAGSKPDVSGEPNLSTPAETLVAE
ncbi:MAG: hypothetical protein ABJG15_19505 [Hyphomonadaceae bacterium]